MAEPISDPLLPLLPPLLSCIPPITLSSRSSTCLNDFPVNWRTETFILPASFPRAFSFQTQPAGAFPRKKRTLEEILEKQLEGNAEQIDLDDWEGQQPLFTVLNRYHNPSLVGEEGKTLVLAHANGFHKEIWEAMVGELLKLEGGVGVKEVFSLDCYNSGMAAVVNEKILGPCFDWSENGRDILNFLINYLDSPTFREVPGPDSTTARLLVPNPLQDPNLLSLDLYVPNAGAKIRKVIGIGHSLGGGGMGFAATAMPSLFSSIILVDPVIKPPVGDAKGSFKLAEGALRRRDSWKDREEARESFLKKEWFQAWDKRVLDSYLEFGLKEVEGGVTLTMKKEDESVVFCDPQMIASQRSWLRLSQISPSLPVHYVLADVGRSVLNEEQIKFTIENVPLRSVTRIAGAGHLIPMEKPRELAKAIEKILREEGNSSSKLKL